MRELETRIIFYSTITILRERNIVIFVLKADKVVFIFGRGRGQMKMEGGGSSSLKWSSFKFSAFKMSVQDIPHSHLNT